MYVEAFAVLSRSALHFRILGWFFGRDRVIWEAETFIRYHQAHSGRDSFTRLNFDHQRRSICTGRVMKTVGVHNGTMTVREYRGGMCVKCLIRIISLAQADSVAPRTSPYYTSPQTKQNTPFKPVIPKQYLPKQQPLHRHLLLPRHLRRHHLLLRHLLRLLALELCLDVVHRPTLILRLRVEGR